MFNQLFIPDVADDRGFANPTAGGLVNVKAWSFQYSDTGIGSGITLFTLPLNAVIVGYTLNVVTAFDGTGDNTFDFGTTGALTQFGLDFDASVTGQASTGFVASQMFTALGETPFTVIYRGTSATAGKAQIAVFYIGISQTIP